jgi:hypothetical protein
VSSDVRKSFVELLTAGCLKPQSGPSSLAPHGPVTDLHRGTQFLKEQLPLLVRFFDSLSNASW